MFDKLLESESSEQMGYGLKIRSLALSISLLCSTCTTAFVSAPFSGKPHQPEGEPGFYLSTEFPDRKYETIAVTQMFKAAVSIFGALDLVDVGPQTMLELLAEEVKKHNADGFVIKSIVIPDPPTDAEKMGRIASTAVAISQENWGAALESGARGVSITLTGELIRFTDQ